MASFSRSAANAFSAGYDLASPRKDKSGQTAYQRYVEKFYGPGVKSHNDPLAMARAATGAVEKGLKTGAGFLSHAAAGLVGAPLGPSKAAPSQGRGGIGSDTGAVSGITPTNRLYGGNPGTGAGVSAYNPGSTRQGMDGVLDAISRAEGTTKNGYNEVLGYGAYGRPSKPITDMTLQEVHDFGRNTLFAGQRAAGKTGPLSSATGRYQITGDNIKAYSKKWGLDMKTTKWTPQLQDRIAIDLAKNTPKGLANWEGFKYKNGPALKKQAIAAMNGQNVSSTVASASAASGDPQVAQLQKDLNAAGAKLTVDGIMGPNTRREMAKYPDTASAYTSTGATTSPAIQAATQAATQEAAGRATSEPGSISRRGSDVAAMQRDLNSRGAKLKVDGLEGPLTRQAAQQFYGSPTSVRTPSFTASPPTPANNWSSLQGSPTSTVNQRQDYVPTPGFTNRQSYTSGRGDEGSIPRAGVASTPSTNQPYTPTSATPRTPYYNNPYTSSTGGASAIDAQTPRYNTYEIGRAAAMSGPPVTPRQVQTVPITRTPYMNQPYTGPEWDVMPGLVQPAPAAPTARLPRARPDQAVPAEPTMLQQLQQQLQRAADIAGQIGSQVGSAVKEGVSRNAGNNYSGGNYTGGSYGGAGGRSISSGVGGAFKNR